MCVYMCVCVTETINKLNKYLKKKLVKGWIVIKL